MTRRALDLCPEAGEVQATATSSTISAMPGCIKAAGAEAGALFRESPSRAQEAGLTRDIIMALAGLAAAWVTRERPGRVARLLGTVAVLLRGQRPVWEVRGVRTVYGPRYLSSLRYVVSTVPPARFGIMMSAVWSSSGRSGQAMPQGGASHD
jgi:hypothetical protein